MPDFHLESHGSIWLLRPYSAAAVKWIDNNIGPKCMTFGSAIAIEPRNVNNIADGIQCAGLTVLPG